MHIILPVAGAPVGVYVHSSPRKGPAHSWDFSNTRGCGGGTAVIMSPMHPEGTYLTLCLLLSPAGGPTAPGGHRESTSNKNVRNLENEHGTHAPVAQWIRRLPTEQEIHGSIPCGGTSCFLLFSGWFQVSLGGSWFQGSLGRSCGASCMFRPCFLLFIVHSTSPLGTCRDRTATVNREFAVLLYWPSLRRATSTPRMQRTLQRITLHRTAVLAKRTFNPNTRYRIG